MVLGLDPDRSEAIAEACHIDIQAPPPSPPTSERGAEAGELSWSPARLSPGEVTISALPLPGRRRRAKRARPETAEGEEVSPALAADSSAASTHAFVRSPTARRNMAQLALALAQRKPVLLEGAFGSGKSSLLREAARRAGAEHRLVELHLDDQLDSKALLGTYVCGEVPGEFEWQPGVLSRAVTDGCWLVIEDVDRAPFEVLSALLPLIQDRKLSIPGRGETLRAHPDFRLFATRSLRRRHTPIAAASAAADAGEDGGEEDTGPLAPEQEVNTGLLEDEEGEGEEELVPADSLSPAEPFLRSLWTRVVVRSLPARELAHVAAALHPALPASVVLSVMASVAALEAPQRCAEDPAGEAARVAGTDLDGALALRLGEAGKQVGHTPYARLAGRALSARDVLKWCARCEALALPSRAHRGVERLARRRRQARSRAEEGAAAAGLDAGAKDDNEDPFTTDAEREAMLAEGLDLLCACLPRAEDRVRLGGALGELWRVPHATVQQRLMDHRPEATPSARTLQVGRVALPTPPGADAAAPESRPFAHTGHSLRLLERVAATVAMREPVLLVGETGCGKTSVIQHLATRTGRQLVVQNLNMQSESADLLGGYKPVNLRQLAAPLYDQCVAVFPRLADMEKAANQRFLDVLARAFREGNWKKLIKGMRRVLDAGDRALHPADAPVQRRRLPADEANAAPAPPVPAAEWAAFHRGVARFARQREHAEASFAFAFVEGVLVRALREGHWLLLDEINLASNETLQRLAGLLDGRDGSLALTERGDTRAVARHPDFRLFAAMNPPTDVGKKELPPALRARFTELYVEEVEDEADLAVIVSRYLGGGASAPVDAVVQTYLHARSMCADQLADGAGQRPKYSLRTLCRALEFARDYATIYGAQRALYEGFTMAFATQLGADSQAALDKVLRGTFCPKAKDRELNKPPRKPKKGEAGRILVEHFWLEEGPHADTVHRRHVLVQTASVRRNLRNLARAVLGRRSPVLLQGPTSSGKTTLVSYLAARTGHRCVAIGPSISRGLPTAACPDPHPRHH